MTRREMLARGIFALAPAACIACGFQDRNRSTSMAGTARVEPLSPDLIPSISQPKVSMAVVVVKAVNLEPGTDRDLEVERGPVTFEVLRPIHGSLQQGQVIEVQARRVADLLLRGRYAFDAWNNLSLSAGENVLLAVSPTTTESIWIGVAAQSVSGPDAPQVRAVLRAYETEDADGGVHENAGRLESALRSDQDILLFYAFGYLRRHPAERDEATRVLAGTTASRPPSERRLELGRALAGEPFFDRSAGADTVNQEVVSAIANALVDEDNAERRTSWAQLAAGCVLMDFTGDEARNRKIRADLVRGPGLPSVGRVAGAIEAARKSATSDLVPYLEKLRRAWETP